MELGPSPGFPRRGQPRVENQDDIMMLLYKIDKSLEKFTETWQSLKHLKALMGRPELENLIGVSQTSLDLKSEVQKARELMIKVRKQEQPRQKTREHSTGDFGTSQQLRIPQIYYDLRHWEKHSLPRAAPTAARPDLKGPKKRSSVRLADKDPFGRLPEPGRCTGRACFLHLI